MGSVEVSESDIRRATRDWRRLARLMEETSGDFAGLSAQVLPPHVQAVGAAFAEAWVGFADQGAHDAEGFVTGLEETLRDFLVSEDDTRQRLRELETSMPSSGRLISRLGPPA